MLGGTSLAPVNVPLNVAMLDELIIPQPVSATAATPAASEAFKKVL
jgi:hypothetical protein